MTTATHSPAATDHPPMLVFSTARAEFCSRSIQFILQHEQRKDLLFVPRDSPLGKQLRHDHGMDTVESMLWIEDGRVFAESDAVMKAAGYLGGGWSRLAAVGSLCPLFLRNAVYRFIARNRRRLSSGTRRLAWCRVRNSVADFWVDGPGARQASRSGQSALIGTSVRNSGRPRNFSLLFLRIHSLPPCLHRYWALKPEPRGSTVATQADEPFLGI